MLFGKTYGQFFFDPAFLPDRPTNMPFCGLCPEVRCQPLWDVILCVPDSNDFHVLDRWIIHHRFVAKSTPRVADSGDISPNDTSCLEQVKSSLPFKALDTHQEQSARSQSVTAVLNEG